ncbi:hypothetical protein Q9233_015655 [Columba guinea]|nr:hypothetical protein Q9233_015655 [Columba guinea]
MENKAVGFQIYLTALVKRTMESLQQTTALEVPLKACNLEQYQHPKGKAKIVILLYVMCLFNFFLLSSLLTGSLESDSYHWEIMGVYDRIAGDVKQPSGMLFGAVHLIGLC